jgi:hypothetical protein
VRRQALSREAPPPLSCYLPERGFFPLFHSTPTSCVSKPWPLSCPPLLPCLRVVRTSSHFVGVVPSICGTADVVVSKEGHVCSEHWCLSTFMCGLGHWNRTELTRKDVAVYQGNAPVYVISQKVCDAPFC